MPRHTFYTTDLLTIRVKGEDLINHTAHEIRVHRRKRQTESPISNDDLLLYNHLRSIVEQGTRKQLCKQGIRFVVHIYEPVRWTYMPALHRYEVQ